MHLSRIEIFPIKSLEPVQLAESAITPGGILENDRVYAIMDREGQFVNGKRTAQIHQLRSSFDEDIQEVCLGQVGDTSPTRFNLQERGPLEGWLSDFFGFHVILRYEPLKGFPDDPIAFGPTIVSEASLRQVGRWYGEPVLDRVRRRFRTNLELDSGDAFSEDQLFGGPDERKPFKIGSVDFVGHNPCQRCVVPTRDPDTGEVLRGFQKTFAELRKKQLPSWVDARRFNHFYRFAVNTSIAPSEGGKRLRLGDAVDV